MLRWKAEDAANKSAEFRQFFEAEYTAWRNGIQAGQPEQYEASVNSILDKWWSFTNDLSAQAEQSQGDTEVVVADLVAEIETQKKILAELQSEATTRTDQADSLNPKSVPSPYTNMLGLQRTFRDSTRTSVFWASVVFAVLALAAAAALVISVVMGGEVFKAPFNQGPATLSAAAGGGRIRRH
jgi:hypothetical protein